MCYWHNRIALINGYCQFCTMEREAKSQSFQYVCACPRCCDYDAHTWVGITFLDGEGIPVHEMRVIRRCINCNYEWRQW